jgi:hypothetical protein
MMNSTESPTDDLAALEHFVVDNDDLLELEERIGRFNIFDALRIARVEIRHSNFLAWLLDPAESHGQGSLFLRTILMDVLREAPVEHRPLSPVELDGTELRGVDIRREWRNIDLLITCEQPAFVIVVENKLGSGEHSRQLGRYEGIVRREFHDKKCMFVFLTTDGSAASEPAWVPYTYADIHRVLDRCRKANERSIGDDVLAFLDHYLRLIGSRFMDDPQIDELCQRVYRNHRQALDLIFEKCGSPGSSLVYDVGEMLSKDAGRWHVFNRTSKRIDFVPADWLSWLPHMGSRPKTDPQAWFGFMCEVSPKACHLLLVVAPCKDRDLRRKVIERLIEDPEEFGFKVKAKEFKDHWTRVFSEVVTRWKEDEEPEGEKVLGTLKKKLDRLFPNLSRVHQALEPILGQAE